MSSILLGDRNTISARMFAEYVASKKDKLTLVSIYLESMGELEAQSILKKLVERAISKDLQMEGSVA
jgi:hypothetical protein